MPYKGSNPYDIPDFFDKNDPYRKKRDKIMGKDTRTDKEKFKDSPWHMEKAPAQKVAPKTVLRPKPKRRPAPKSEPNLSQQLLAQLAAQVSSMGAGTVDYESALRESERAIRQAYAADISAIRSGNRAARKQTAADRRELEQMYNALSKSYRKAGKAESRQSNRLSERMQTNANQSARTIQNLGQKMIEDQGELAKNLGIEARMPAASEGVTKEASRTRNRIVKEGASDANRTLGFGGISRRFMNRGGQTAKYEGANRSADLLGDLQNFLQENQQQIAHLKGQRAREIATNKQETQQSVAEMQASAESEMWDRLMSLAGLSMDMEKEGWDQQMDAAKLRQDSMPGSSNSMPGLENVSNSEYYVNQARRPGAVANSLEELLGSTQMRHGNYFDKQSNSTEKMTVYQAREMAKQIAQQNGLGPRETQLLMLAIEARMG